MAAIAQEKLQQRLAEVIATHEVPGASLGVLTPDGVTVAAAGLLNLNTKVEATSDSLFQIGSITKVWTATLIMQLVDEGRLDLDKPVVDALPGFQIADASVTSKVTPRHLLAHSSGISGDHFLDVGRGDDCLEKYVASCTELGIEHELGATMSYSNSGYVILGRIIEVLTGKSWDKVLTERLIAPLGLKHTNTLPEQALLFRAAVGHIALPGKEAQVAPSWVLPRAVGPAGLINSTASDVLAFAKMHLDHGRAPDGTQILSAASVDAMQQGQVAVPDTYSYGDQWGLGWMLFGWDGRRGYAHDGGTIGQFAFLRVLPDAGVAISLLTNGGAAKDAFAELCGELSRELAGVRMPVLPRAPSAPLSIDLADYEGRYERLNVSCELKRDDRGGLSCRTEAFGPIATMLPPSQRVQTTRLSPIDRALFLVYNEVTPNPVPLVFFDFDGSKPRRFHSSARAMTRRV